MGYYLGGDGNCYGRGDYYRGDYYRGGDGLPILGAVARFAPKLIRAGAKLVQKVIGKKPGTGLITLPRVGAVATGAAAAVTLGGLFTGGPGEEMGMGMMCAPKGTRANKSTYVTRGGGTSRWPQELVVHEKGTECVKARRMNVTNVRALRKAIRRATGFAKLSRRVLSFVQAKAPKGKAVFKRKR
jgi:hypothetical protein